MRQSPLMSGRYKLKGKEPVRVDDLIEWAKWIEAADRQIARDTISGAVVSTVFLGLDHQFGDGLPILFETLVFGGALDGEGDRYSTWDEAAAGHVILCVKVKLAQAGIEVAHSK